MSNYIDMKCHVCGRGRITHNSEDGQKNAYNEGWRLWVVKGESRYLCPTHAMQRTNRRLTARLKRMYG